MAHGHGGVQKAGKIEQAVQRRVKGKKPFANDGVMRREHGARDGGNKLRLQLQQGGFVILNVQGAP